MYVGVFSIASRLQINGPAMLLLLSVGNLRSRLIHLRWSPKVCYLY
jgi:hypothetical protein